MDMIIQKNTIQSSFYHIFDVMTNENNITGERIEDCVCILVPWLTENLGTCDEDRWFFRLSASGVMEGYFSIYIRNDGDALAFKLMWS
jgi:hypothetical protein